MAGVFLSFEVFQWREDKFTIWDDSFENELENESGTAQVARLTFAIVQRNHIWEIENKLIRFFWRSTSNTRISNQRMTFWTQGCSSLIWGTYLCFYRCYQLSTQAVGGDCGRGWKSKLPTQTWSDELKPDQGIYVALGRISLEFLKATKNCSSSVQLCLVCSSLHLHTEAMEANIWKMKNQQWSFTQAIFDAESTFCYRSISKFVSNR